MSDFWFACERKSETAEQFVLFLSNFKFLGSTKLPLALKYIYYNYLKFSPSMLVVI